jgi:hypothetical protein
MHSSTPSGVDTITLAAPRLRIGSVVSAVGSSGLIVAGARLHHLLGRAPIVAINMVGTRAAQHHPLLVDHDPDAARRAGGRDVGDDLVGTAGGVVVARSVASWDQRSLVVARANGQVSSPQFERQPSVTLEVDAARIPLQRHQSEYAGGRSRDGDRCRRLHRLQAGGLRTQTPGPANIWSG